MIGVDPPNASHTAVAIDKGEDELKSKLATVKVRAIRGQLHAVAVQNCVAGPNPS